MLSMSTRRTVATNNENRMSITQFNKSACNTVADEAMAALQEVATRHGLTLKREGGRFDTGSFTLKTTFVCTTEGGIPADWARNAKLLGLEPSDFGKSFVSRGQTYTICGVKIRARKYPVLAKKADGGIYKFPEATVKAGLELAAKKAS